MRERAVRLVLDKTGDTRRVGRLSALLPVSWTAGYARMARAPRTPWG